MLKYATRKAMSNLGAILATATLTLTACQTETDAVKSQPSEGPALWTVKDEDTTLHLFGYAPVLKNDTEWQTQTIMTAFNEAELVILETDSTDPEGQAEVQSLIPALGLNTDGRTLSTILNDAQREEINAVSAGLGTPLQALDALKPWLASIQLGVLAVSQGGYDLANTPAATLVMQTKNSGKRLVSLEEPTYVLKIIAGFSEAEQIEMLLHTARVLRDDPEQQAQIADAWLSGDVDQVGIILHGPGGAWATEVMYEALLVQRNKVWLSEINRLLSEEQGTIFLAVGLGHLAGKDSLVSMLEKSGQRAARR